MNKDTRTKRVIALGFFDGVHMAHGALLKRTVLRAQENGAIPCAFTFDLHPASQIMGRQIPMLTSPGDREMLMRRYYKIEELIVASFKEMAGMPWKTFITDYLAKDLNVCHVIAGHDFHFGDKGEGNPEKLKETCAELGIGCDIIERVELEGITVSSTYIRQLIEEGDMERAISFMGHPHIFSGTVVHGKKLGSTIGFPTANLIVPSEVIVPAFGVYASRVTLPDGTVKMAVTNVGTRPTVDDGDRVTVEPWILDYSGDLYGKEICVEYYKKLRDEKKFSGLDELKEMVYKNADETRAYFSQDSGIGKSAFI